MWRVFFKTFFTRAYRREVLRKTLHNPPRGPNPPQTSGEESLVRAVRTAQGGRILLKTQDLTSKAGRALVSRRTAFPSALDTGTAKLVQVARPWASPSDRLPLHSSGSFRLSFWPTRSMNGGAMHIDFTRPYFNMNIEACRAAGARGGRRSARNRRLREVHQPPQSTQIGEPHLETAAEAIAALDARFPWLRGAEHREAR